TLDRDLELRRIGFEPFHNARRRGVDAQRPGFARRAAAHGMLGATFITIAATRSSTRALAATASRAWATTVQMGSPAPTGVPAFCGPAAQSGKWIVGIEGMSWGA